MEKPSRVVPEGLSAHAYARLAVQYCLLGWHRQSVRAGRLALALFEQEKLAKDSKSSTSSSVQNNSAEAEFDSTDFDQIRSLVDGIDGSYALGEEILGFSRAVYGLFRDGLEFASQITDELIANRQGLKVVKYGVETWTEELGRKSLTFFNKVIQDVLRSGKPPRVVPSFLPGEQYLALGEAYLRLGWTEQAREAFEFACDKAEGTSIARRADLLLRTRLPVQPVPFLAVEGLIDTRRHVLAGDHETARRILKELIEMYPRFEYPYKELAELEIRVGELEKARNILACALDINQDYLDAWLLQARLEAILGHMLESQAALDKAMDLDATDERIRTLRQLVALLARLRSMTT